MTSLSHGGQTQKAYFKLNRDAFILTFVYFDAEPVNYKGKMGSSRRLKSSPFSVAFDIGASSEIVFSELCVLEAIASSIVARGVTRPLFDYDGLTLNCAAKRKVRNTDVCPLHSVISYSLASDS